MANMKAWAATAFWNQGRRSGIVVIAEDEDDAEQAFCARTDQPCEIQDPLDRRWFSLRPDTPTEFPRERSVADMAPVQDLIDLSHGPTVWGCDHPALDVADNEEDIHEFILEYRERISVPDVPDV